MLHHGRKTILYSLAPCTVHRTEGIASRVFYCDPLQSPYVLIRIQLTLHFEKIKWIKHKHQLYTILFNNFMRYLHKIYNMSAQ
jgi:hypothetical protein